MKKYICKIIVFFALFFVIDIIVGFVGDKMVKLSKGGDTRLQAYINDEMQEEVLFFGSSRCMHHYIPSIIDDSLGVLSYNCGTDGMGIPFLYARYKLITSRIKPKVIFYDVYPAWDLYSNMAFPNTRNLKWLKPYYNRNEIKEVFNDIDPLSKFKYRLNMYRYNGFLLELAKDIIRPSRSFDKGFTPLTGTISPDYKITVDLTGNDLEVDPLKIKYWEKFLTATKQDGIKVVFLFSPMWGKPDDSIPEAIISLASKYNIPILNHFCAPFFYDKRHLFSEPWHLNGEGAIEYSKYICSELKQFVE